MQHDGAVRCAAHARVGDAHHVLYAGARKPGGNRQVARFRHAVAALRPRILHDEKIVRLDVERGIVDARGKVRGRAKHDSAAAALEEPRVGR